MESHQEPLKLEDVASIQITAASISWPWPWGGARTTDSKPMAHRNQRKIDELNFITIKNVCTSKDPIKKVKRHPTQREKILQLICLIRGLYPEYIKNTYNSTTASQMTQFKNEQKTWIDISPKKMCKWPISTWKDAPHHRSLGKCKSKPWWDTTSHPLGQLLSKRQTITSVDKDVGKLEPPYIVGGILK